MVNRTLYYIRHPEKEGEVIGEKGLVKAQALGQIFKRRTGLYFTRVFHGPMLRTAQGALAICAQLGYPVLVEPIIAEIGTASLFETIATPAFREAVKSGLSNYRAISKVHDVASVLSFSNTATEGLSKMFDRMSEVETAFAVGHSPIIELAADAIAIPDSLPEGWHNLHELEGLVFVQSADCINVESKFQAKL